MTSRKRVYKTLDFEIKAGDRIPRHLWWLPWVEENHQGTVSAIQREFSDDIVNAPGFQTLEAAASWCYASMATESMPLAKLAALLGLCFNRN